MLLHQDDLCNALVLHQGHCFFYVPKMQQYFYHLGAQRRDHMLDDDLDPLYISEKLWILGNL